jgi:hypothetical protein
MKQLLAFFHIQLHRNSARFEIYLYQIAAFSSLAVQCVALKGMIRLSEDEKQEGGRGFNQTC